MNRPGDFLPRFTETAIELDRVTKYYSVRPVNLTLTDRVKNAFRSHRIRVLNEVSLTVPKGFNFGIIGLNGSGKSTLLRILAGVSDYDSGSITINGRVASLLELGAGFHNDLTGRENIYLNAALMGFTQTEIEEKLGQIIAFADIGEYIDHPLRTYSSGMKVRLGFSVAIHIDPQILLVDEVLAVGDQDFKQKCIEKILALKERDVTILLVTHSMSQVRRVCDRVACLHEHTLYPFDKIEEGIEFYLEKVRNKTEAQLQREHQALLDDQKKLKSERSVRWGSGGAEIIRVTFADEARNTRFTFDPGQPFTCRMEIRFNEDALDPIFGFIFKDEKKYRIFNTNTMWRNYRLGQFKAGENVVFEARCPGILLSGTYYMTCAVAYTDGDRFYDWIEDVVRFNIQDTPVARGIVDLRPSFSIDGIPLDDWIDGRMK